MDSIDRAKLSFELLRSRRIATREALSSTLRHVYDETLSHLLLEFLRSSPARTPLRPIVRILNKGAIASLLNPYELGGPNLGDLVDILEDSKIEPHRIFILLDHIIASPCDSWATNRRYVGNGGMPLPDFLIAAVATGDFWGYPSQKHLQSMWVRFRAWCSLRKMIWAYQHDLSAQRLPTRRTGFVARLFSTFLWYVSSKERNFTFSDVERRLFHSLISFFKPQSKLLLLEEGSLRCLLPFGPFATGLLLQVDDGVLFHKYFEPFSVKILFNRFFMNRLARKRTLKLCSYRHFRSWILCEDGVRELCRRKERVLFKELYMRDSQALTAMIPFALSVLESKSVQGCKGRLIEFLNDALLRNEETEEMGNNLTGEFSYLKISNNDV